MLQKQYALQNNNNSNLLSNSINNHNQNSATNFVYSNFQNGYTIESDPNHSNSHH